MSKPKKKYTNLGTIIQAKENPQYPDQKRFYLKLEQSKDVSTGESYGEQVFPITLANGKKLNDGDILTLFSKQDEFDRKVKAGKMKQQDADRLSFLKFGVSLVEDVNEGSDDSDSGSGVNF